jgi:hypothetical protein
MASTAETGVYKLYLPLGLKLLLGFVLLALAGGGFAIIVVPLLAHAPKAPPPLFGAYFLVIICIALFSILNLPHRITLAPDGALEFISILRRRVLRAEEIRSIKPSSHLGFFLVRTDGPKIRLLAQFDNFHDFLTRLQALNPRGELRGC